VRRPDPRQLAEGAFDVACIGLLVSGLAVVWTLAAVWACQIFVTCLIIGLVAGWVAGRLEAPAPVASGLAAQPREVRQDTISEEEYPETRLDAPDRYAGLTLEEAFEQREDELERAEEAQAPVA